MNYAAIKKVDIANGPGVRVTLFVSGCTHHCKECFQSETWDFQYGQLFDETVEDQLLKALAPDYIRGLTLLGGEPFEPANQRRLVSFLRKVRLQYPDKDIWCFSGYVWEELTGQEPGTGRARCEVTDEMLSLIDVLVDGEFELENKDITLQFRGSSNQRLIRVAESRKQDKIIWWTSDR